MTDMAGLLSTSLEASSENERRISDGHEWITFDKAISSEVQKGDH